MPVVVGVLTAGVVFASCRAQVDVRAREQVALTIATTEPPLPPSTPAPTTSVAQPQDTEPDAPTPDDQSTADPRVASLLVMPGDIDGWTIELPRLIGPENAAASDCPAVDALRSFDARDKWVTQGSEASERFQNFLYEMESSEAATAFMDSVSATLACSPFQDAGGPSTVGWLSVPDAEGWRSNGVVFGGATAAASIGYWQRDATIVKLRVPGGDGFTRPAVALAGKLTAFTTGVPPPRRPETWELDPLATSVITVDQLPPGWTRTDVQLIEPSPAATDGPCGLAEPPTPGGLVADFAHGGIVLRQTIVRATPAVAQEWVDTLRRVASCPDLGAIDEATLPDAATIGADDVAGILVNPGPLAGSASNATVGARFGGVFVLITWGSPALAPDGVLSLDQAVALLGASAPD